MIRRSFVFLNAVAAMDHDELAADIRRLLPTREMPRPQQLRQDDPVDQREYFYRR